MNIALKMLLEDGDGAIKRIQGMPDAASQLTDPDYWGSVGILTLTGILVVFLILAILIFVFWLMGTIFKAVNKSKEEKKALEEAAKVEAPAPAPVVEEAVQADDEEELVAVISAAIAAYEGDGGFTITSIRRSKGKSDSSRSAWSLAGLNGNMRQF